MSDDCIGEPLHTGEALPRNPELMRPEETALLVVDVQERLIAVERGAKRVVWNIRRLLDGAKVLGVQRVSTEQSPEKLGTTLPELSERIDTRAAGKLAFSCGECGSIFREWNETGIHRVLVCGIETHVCVQQTVLDLLGAGYQVQIAVDAVTARHAIDHETALRRMDSSGATLTTTETALFEWCAKAGTPEFRQISELVKETGP